MDVDIDVFMDLFVNRADVFAEQQPDGSYFPVRSRLTADDVAEHLSGMASYGSYVIDPANQCVTYVCWDLDIMDEEAADMLCSLVEQMVRSPDILPPRPGAWDNCTLREFSGNKGTHVWLFFDAPVHAEKVRRWVAADFMPAWVEVANEKGWPAALEVFPKQDTVPEGGFGNLVKLPLGVHRVSGARSEIVGCRGWPTEITGVVPLPASLVPDRTVAVGMTRRHGERAGRGQGTGPATPFPCVDTIMREGVGQGQRDRAMFHLALYCYGHGLDQDLALEVCNRANENFQPPLRASEVTAKVASAYRGTHESASCGADWLAAICPGPCRTGWHVRRNAVGGELAHAATGSTVEVEVVGTHAEEGRKRVTVRHPDADNTPTFLVTRGGA